MSDFVINFNLLGGLSLDESRKEMDRMEEDEKKKADALKLMRKTLKSWKSQETKAVSIINNPLMIIKRSRIYH